MGELGRGGDQLQRGDSRPAGVVLGTKGGGVPVAGGRGDSRPEGLILGTKGGGYQVQEREVTAALQAWFLAPTGNLATLGLRHICCRDPRMAARGLHHTSFTLLHEITSMLVASSMFALI